MTVASPTIGPVRTLLRTVNVQDVINTLIFDNFFIFSFFLGYITFNITYYTLNSCSKIVVNYFASQYNLSQYTRNHAQACLFGYFFPFVYVFYLWAFASIPNATMHSINGNINYEMLRTIFEEPITRNLAIRATMILLDNQVTAYEHIKIFRNFDIILAPLHNRYL